MRKTVLFLISFLVLSMWGSAQEKSRLAVYGVAFYNLENLFDTINNNGKYDLEFSPQGSRQWNGEKYWSKINNMATVFKAMESKYLPAGPAVVGVAEIENVTVLQDLVNAEPIRDKGWQIVHYDSPDKRGVDVGLLYNPKYFKVLSTDSRRLYIPSKPDFLTRDQLVVTGLLGGDKISIIVNHWPSRLGGESQSSYLREAAAALTRSIADSLLREDPSAGVIIMGDLNDDPGNVSVREVIGAKKYESEVEAGGFFNPFWLYLDRGIGTLGYQGNWNLFDQIIISENLLGKDRTTLKYWKAEVFNRPFLTNESGAYKGYPKRTYAGGVFLNGYSDHYPTLIYLVKRK
jgi:hypothetical protein